EALWSVAIGALARPAAPVGATLNAATARLPARATAVPIVRGLLIAAPFLLVFTALLASADVVFGAYVDRVLRVDFGINPLGLLGHACRSLAGGRRAAARAAPGAGGRGRREPGSAHRRRGRRRRPARPR